MVQKIREGKPHASDIMWLLKDMLLWVPRKVLGTSHVLALDRKCYWSGRQRMGTWCPPEPHPPGCGHSLLSPPTRSTGATDPLPGWRPWLQGAHAPWMISLGVVQREECQVAFGQHLSNIMSLTCVARCVSSFFLKEKQYEPFPASSDWIRQKLCPFVSLLHTA